MSASVLSRASLELLPLLFSGKVREVFDAGFGRLLIVTSDRISAFDVILDDLIPGKGAVLTELSKFWFARFRDVIPNHFMNIDPELVVLPKEYDQIRGRSMLVRRLEPLMIEAVVRGYLIGSGWKDYQQSGAVCGIKLPAGLKQAEKLPTPIFTPATKAAAGEHDENISFETAAEIVGLKCAEQIRDVALRLYTEAAKYAADRGIIIADTKFEFGLDANGALVLIDEVLTPDSSRLWPSDQYQVGISPPSFDKQFVRDWLEKQPWNKKAPAPRLPQEVILQTSAKYHEALYRLTGLRA